MKYINSVVVVDDQNLLSAAIAQMINSFKNFKVVDTFRSSQIEHIFKDTIPDIIVVNVNQSSLECLRFIQKLVKTHTQLKVMALFCKHDATILSEILKAGVDGYIHKDTKKEMFESALLALTKNASCSTNNLEKEALVFKENELKFMKLACSELTYKEIAEKMFLSPKTIDGYRNSLFNKLNVKNRVGMVLYALKHRIYVQ